MDNQNTLAERIAAEVNGDSALRHVYEITNYHRSLGGAEYHEAAAYLKRYLRNAGLTVSSVDAPLDNTTVAGNYTLPFAWEPHSAILKVVSPEERTLVNFAQTPTCINSWSAATPPGGVTAELVYVGEGTRDEHYAGKDVKGKIVLVDKGYTWMTHPLAVEKYGAIGFINDDIREIPFYKTRAMYPDWVLWNTLYERQLDGLANTGFALSISPRMGDYLRALIKQGPVKLHAEVDARTFVGVMENPVAIIEGSQYPDEEVFVVAHLCHTRPGAVDNAAGCAHIAETARAINAMISRGDLARPKRSITFMFDPEGHGSNVYFHSIRDRLDKVIAGLGSHCGGDPAKLEAGLRLTRTSGALPSFLNDVCLDALERVNDQFTAPGPRAQSPLSFVVLPPGLGQVASGWGVPAVEMGPALNRFWHTPDDTPDKVSAQELARASWLYAMIVLRIADAGLKETMEIMASVEGRSEQRLIEAARLACRELAGCAAGDAAALVQRTVDHLRYLCERDSAAIASALALVRHEDSQAQDAARGACTRLTEKLAAKQRVEEEDVQRFAASVHGALPATPGPSTPLPPEATWKPRMNGPGWIEMKRLTVTLGAKYDRLFASKPGVMRARGFLVPMYEVCNLSNGERTVAEIARIVSHELGPLDVETAIEIVKDIQAMGFMAVA